MEWLFIWLLNSLRSFHSSIDSIIRYVKFFVASDDLVHEKEKYKAISEELDQTFQELSGY